MDRTELLRAHIDSVYSGIGDDDERRCAFVHSYGVAFAAALLAKKRGLDPELAVMSGMLHDFFVYSNYADENCYKDHGRRGAVFVRDVLGKLALTTDAETDIICNAIAVHCDKDQVHEAYCELLKDADVLQHNLYNPMFPTAPHEIKRYSQLQNELNIK